MTAADSPPQFMIYRVSGRKTGTHPRIKSEGKLLLDTRYAWTTKCLVVCTGERELAGVKLKFFQML